MTKKISSVIVTVGVVVSVVILVLVVIAHNQDGIKSDTHGNAQSVHLHADQSGGDLESESGDNGLIPGVKGEYKTNDDTAGHPKVEREHDVDELKGGGNGSNDGDQLHAGVKGLPGDVCTGLRDQSTDDRTQDLTLNNEHPDSIDLSIQTDGDSQICEGNKSQHTLLATGGSQPVAGLNPEGDGEDENAIDLNQVLPPVGVKHIAGGPLTVGAHDNSDQPEVINGSDTGDQHGTIGQHIADVSCTVAKVECPVGEEDDIDADHHGTGVCHGHGTGDAHGGHQHADVEDVLIAVLENGGDDSPNEPNSGAIHNTLLVTHIHTEHVQHDCLGDVGDGVVAGTHHGPQDVSKCSVSQ